MEKAETKTEQMVCYEQIWVAHYIAPSYLDELLKGAKEQHRNFIENQERNNNELQTNLRTEESV